MKKFIANSLLLAYSSAVLAIQVNPRSESLCGLLNNSIYCYGGLLTGNVIDNQLYQLPISDLPVNKSMINLAKEWNVVYAANNESYALEYRRRSNSVVYNNGNSFFITGGYSFENESFVNQTIAYHVNTNSWETLNTYTDNQGRKSQIYNSAVVSLTPVQNKILLFGGDTEYPTFNSTVPIQIDSSNRTVMHAGYTTLTVFDLDTLLWSSYSPQSNAPTLANTYSAQNVVYNPRNNLIYYLGGFSSPQSDYTVENKVTFKQAMVFNVTSGAWLSQNLTGTAPSGRNFPTATLLPNSNDILLYGGTSTGTVTAYTDFCYTLNLDENKWTRQNIETAGVNSAPRFAHSAVLVNTTLFIMFGLVVYGNPLSDILALSVNDVQNLYFPDTYPYVEQPKVIVPSADAVSEGLSKGAVAGIAVGCVVGGLALCGALVFFYLRRKKQQKQKVDEMSVDWEQVENFYTEDDNHSQHPEKPANNESDRNVYSPNAYNDDEYTARDSTTLSASSHPMKTETLYLVKPSAIDETETARTASVKSPVLSPAEKPDFS